MDQAWVFLEETAAQPGREKIHPLRDAVGDLRRYANIILDDRSRRKDFSSWDGQPWQGLEDVDVWQSVQDEIADWTIRL